MDPSINHSALFLDDLAQIKPISSSYLNSIQSHALYADLFYERTFGHSLLAERTGTSHIAPRTRVKNSFLQGVGLHAINEGQRIYRALPGKPVGQEVAKTTDDIKSQLYSPPTSDIFQSNRTQECPAWSTDSPASTTVAEKEALVHSVIESAFSYEPDLQFCSVEYQDVARQTYLANSEGSNITQRKSWMALHLCLSLSKTNTTPFCITRRAWHTFGDFTFHALDQLVIQSLERAAHRQRSQPIRSGTWDVVFAAGTASTWLHEAIGHLLEADQAHSLSIPAPQLVAPHVSIHDSALNEKNEVGYPYDDEGVPGTLTLLIEDGDLKQVLTDRHQAYLLNIPHTGNGRRSSYQHPPLPRMSSLYMKSLSDSPFEILSSVQQGIYVKSIDQGSTLPGSNQFNLHVNDAQRIENGTLTSPLSNLVIRGEGISTLQKIDRIGSDAPECPATVLCHKQGQVLPVSVSTPTVLIKDMTIEQLAS